MNRIHIWVALGALSVMLWLTGDAQAQTSRTNLMPRAVMAAGSVSTTNTLMPLGLKVEFDQNRAQFGTAMRVVILMTLLSLAPGMIIMTTSFTRIIIVFGFLRQAMGTQSTPPNQVLTSLAIFLSIFIMAPVWQKINTNAIQPYMNNELTETQAWTAGIAPLHAFMLKQTGNNELGLFLEISKRPMPKDRTKIPIETLIPAFMISELKTAFQMGFLIYLPFLIIDLVVSTSLMALGMMMLPPMMISLPIKLLFFVLADGWTLLIRNIVVSFKL